MYYRSVPENPDYGIPVFTPLWYVPTNRGSLEWITQDLETTRTRIWNFKDGFEQYWAISLIRNLWKEMEPSHKHSLDDGEKILFVPIPASTMERTEQRLLEFSSLLCEQFDDWENGYDAIERIEDTQARHLANNNRERGLRGVRFKADRLANRKVIIFDDVMTSGGTIIDYALELRKMGCSMIAITLAKTVPLGYTIDSHGNLVNQQGRIAERPITGMVSARSTRKRLDEESLTYSSNPEALTSIFPQNMTLIPRVHTSENGTVYIGEFVQDSLSGRGTITYRNGKSYQGDIVNKKLHGNGTFKGANGKVYTGVFFENELRQGTLKTPSGLFYKGDFHKYTPHGSGFARFPSGRTYKGEFKLGRLTGLGTTHFPSGNRYEGEHLNGDAHGEGVFTFKNGTVYTGNLRKNQYSGFGKIVYANGRTYEGEFRENKFHGIGKLIEPNGDIYEGNFIHGKKTSGKLRFSSNDVYEGEFQDNKPTGKGTMTYSDGALYVGEFMNGQRSGKGTLSSPNGGKVEGLFDADRILTGSITAPNGKFTRYPNLFNPKHLPLNSFEGTIAKCLELSEEALKRERWKLFMR